MTLFKHHKVLFYLQNHRHQDILVFSKSSYSDTLAKHPIQDSDFVLLYIHLLVERWIFNNYSSIPNGLGVNWLISHEGVRSNSFRKIQLVGQKYRDEITLASKTRFSCHCFGFQSRRFSLLTYCLVVAQTTGWILLKKNGRYEKQTNAQITWHADYHSFALLYIIPKRSGIARIPRI